MLYALPWTPLPQSYAHEGPLAAAKRNERRRRGIKETPSPSQRPWDLRPEIKRHLHWEPLLGR